jgi:hypothetical protein
MSGHHEVSPLPGTDRAERGHGEKMGITVAFASYRFDSPVVQVRSDSHTGEDYAEDR